MLKWLARNDIKAQLSKKAFTYKGVKYPKGTIVVPMYQAKRSLARPPAAKEPKITVQEPTGEARDYKRMVLVRRPIRRQVGTETRQVLRRKAPRRGKGFRIAVYSGGNTREDRNKAELAGQKVKDALPDQPVYVHFYSPRWMCLVGNFEEYKDAQKALWKVKKAGYKSANIIRK